jgi:hypothetical protein
LKPGMGSATGGNERSPQPSGPRTGRDRARYSPEPERSAEFAAAMARLGDEVCVRILDSVGIFVREWREASDDRELWDFWQVSPLTTGSLANCKVMQFCHIHYPGTVHYRIAYLPVPEPAPRLVFIDAFTPDDLNAAVNRISVFVKRQGYC